MTHREKALFRLAHDYKMLYLESNPDIGMGPFRDLEAKELAAEAGLGLEELQEFLKEMQSGD